MSTEMENENGDLWVGYREHGLENVVPPRRPVLPATAEAFQIAKLLFEKHKGVELNYDEAYLDPEYASLELSPYLVYAEKKFYETYIGDYPAHPPRFDLDYIYRIDCGVLELFLPYLRRADYLCEMGFYTNIDTRADSIVINSVGGDSSENVPINLRDFMCTGIDFMAGETKSTLWAVTDDMQSFHLDDLMLSTPIGQCVPCKSPTYNDIKNRYYDYDTFRTPAKGMIPMSN